MRPRSLRETNQFVGVRQRSGQRLFDQNIDPGFHQGASGLQMVDCGYGNRGGLDFAVGGDELLDGTESAATEFAGDGVGARQVWIDHPHQADGFALLRQLVIDAGMVASEGAHADHGYVNDVVGSQVPCSRARLMPI